MELDEQHPSWAGSRPLPSRKHPKPPVRSQKKRKISGHLADFIVSYMAMRDKSLTYKDLMALTSTNTQTKQ